MRRVEEMEERVQLHRNSRYEELGLDVTMTAKKAVDGMSILKHFEGLL